MFLPGLYRFFQSSAKEELPPSLVFALLFTAKYGPVSNARQFSDFFSFVNLDELEYRLMPVCRLSQH